MTDNVAVVAAMCLAVGIITLGLFMVMGRAGIRLNSEACARLVLLWPMFGAGAVVGASAGDFLIRTLSWAPGSLTPGSAIVGGGLMAFYTLVIMNFGRDGEDVGTPRAAGSKAR